MRLLRGYANDGAYLQLWRAEGALRIVFIVFLSRQRLEMFCRGVLFSLIFSVGVDLLKSQYKNADLEVVYRLLVEEYSRPKPVILVTPGGKKYRSSVSVTHEVCVELSPWRQQPHAWLEQPRKEKIRLET